MARATNNLYITRTLMANAIIGKVVDMKARTAPPISIVIYFFASAASVACSSYDLFPKPTPVEGTKIMLIPRRVRIGSEFFP